MHALNRSFVVAGMIVTAGLIVVATNALASDKPGSRARRPEAVPTLESTRDPATGMPRRYSEINVATRPLETAQPGRMADFVGPPEREAARREAMPPVQNASPSITVGRFTSVQVNVNALGNDILNDAANEPTIAVDPTNPNRMAICWRQFDTIANNFRQAGRAYTTNGGATWTFPGVVDPGQFRSDPVLASDSTGRFFFSSLSSTTSVEMFRSLDGGVTWPLETPAFGGDKQWMTVDRSGGVGNGHVYQIWNVQFSCCGNADFTRSTNGGVSFQGPFALPQPSMKWGTLDVGPDGTLYSAGSTLGQTGHLFARSRNAKFAAVTPAFDPVVSIDLGGLTGGFSGASPNPGGLLGEVWIATDHSNTVRRGNLYVLASVTPAVGTDPHNIHFIRSTDDGATWSAPVRVNDDLPTTNAYQWFGAISVAPNGRIDVTYNDTRNDATPSTPNTSQTRYTYSLDGGVTWYPSEVFTPAWNHFLGYPQQNKIGDYTHMWSNNGGGRLAYPTTFTGGQDVYFVRLTPDCNGNGVADEADITNLTSVDCNGDLTPDECEPFIDCNNNTINDICDVAALTSDDCNTNQVPDECESQADCNNNTIQDICDIAAGTSEDCNDNGIPDECEAGEDCNNNDQVDTCDIAFGLSEDCNENGVPDECDIADGTSDDVNKDGVPDECVGACCRCGICTGETEPNCALAEGAFYGPGTSCASANCEDPDACSAAQPLPSLVSVSVPFSNLCALTDGPPNVPCDAGSVPFGADLWYLYTAPCCGDMTVSLCGDTTFDSVLAVYGGQASCTCPTNNTTLLECDDDSCGGGGPSRVTLPVIDGRCYTIRLGGFSSANGSGDLNVTVTCNPLACGLADPPSAEPGGQLKNRYLSFVGPNPGEQTAIRVTLSALPPPFAASIGQVRWVGTPQNVSETPTPPTTFKASSLVCNPVYRDWGADGLVQVSGDAIVPGGQYLLEAVKQACDVGNVCAFSDPLSVSTGKWGDVVPLFFPSGGQPNFLDISAVVAKFQQAPGAVTTARADLSPDTPDRLVDFLDISRAVQAFQGNPYPFDGPSSCP